jgi:hypothetical protein
MALMCTEVILGIDASSMEIPIKSILALLGTSFSGKVDLGYITNPKLSDNVLDSG